MGQPGFPAGIQRWNHLKVLKTDEKEMRGEAEPSPTCQEAVRQAAVRQAGAGPSLGRGLGPWEGLGRCRSEGEWAGRAGGRAGPGAAGRGVRGGGGGWRPLVSLSTLQTCFRPASQVADATAPALFSLVFPTMQRV